MQYTYIALRRLLTAQQTEPGGSVEVEPGITIHDHPQSGRPEEIHLMADGQKVAEIGPVTGTEGDTSDVAPSYIDFLAEWAGKPVRHEDLKLRVMQDNGLIAVEDNREVALAHAVLDALQADRHADVFIRSEELAHAVLARHVVHADYTAAVAGARVRVGGGL